MAVRGLEDFLEALQRPLQRCRVGDELAGDEVAERVLVPVATCPQPPERKHLSHALRGAAPLALARLGHHRLDQRCRQLGAGPRVQRRRLRASTGTAEECGDEKGERTTAHEAVVKDGRENTGKGPFLSWVTGSVSTTPARPPAGLPSSSCARARFPSNDGARRCFAMARTPSTMVALGTLAPRFALPDVRTGKTVALEDFAGRRALLVMFICRHCPFVVHVQGELAKVGRDYEGQDVGWVAISYNDVQGYPDDAPTSLAEQAREQGFGFPYLFDESQAVARAYDAACTPDFFLFRGESGRFPSRLPGPARRQSAGKRATGDRARLAKARWMPCSLESPSPEPQRPSIGCNIKMRSNFQVVALYPTPIQTGYLGANTSLEVISGRVRLAVGGCCFCTRARGSPTYPEGQWWATAQAPRFTNAHGASSGPQGFMPGPDPARLSSLRLALLRNFAVDVPTRFLEVFGGVPLEVCAPYVFHRVSEVEAHPFDDLDALHAARL